MLTITAPIELKCKVPEHSMHEGFYHRITDPYSMMSINLTPEELLHVMTTAPEYYFGGGDETSIFQQMNVHTHQENNLEVINNLMNRITVHESAELTYQDRVYITDILQKMGIRKVSEFMQQVRQIKQEQDNTTSLIDLYWNHATELRQLIENYHSMQKSEQVTQELTEQSQMLHLHEDILNRLQTAAVYQIVQNFNRRQQGDIKISNTELLLSEQYRTAQNILLQKLKSEARGEHTPLIFRHENYYEEQQLSEERVNENTILSQISSAVLLNLVDNVYQSRSDQRLRSGDSWYHMEQAFYQNAENTMQRIENRISSHFETDRNTEHVYQARYNEFQNNEISILNQLFEERHSEQYQTVNELLRQEMVRQELVNRMTQQTDEQLLLEQIEQITRAQYYSDHSSQVVNRLLDKHVSNIEQTNARELRQMIEQQKQLNRTDHYELSRIEHRNIENNEGDILQEQNIYDQKQNVTDQQLTVSTERINQLQQDTINVQQKYMQTIEGIRETMERTASQAQDEAYRISHPTDHESADRLYTERKNVNVAEGDVYDEQTTYEQTQNIDKRNISTIEQELSRINRENINNQYKYMQMMEGIRESMERPRERKSPEQMRRESLMGLEHPTEMLEQLRAEGEKQQEAKQEKLSQVMKLLPEQTRAVYETIREYLEAPMELRREMTGVSDDMGMLIRDIHQAELVQKQSKLVHTQQEQLHEQTREVIDRWNEHTPEQPQKKQVYEQRHTDVTLVHRSQQQQVDEELIQQMMEQNRTLSNTVRTQNETITNYDKTERTYHNINTQQVISQEENVTELVRQGVQRELGALSEKIYHKLEKRLESEKRRRGY